ncbi:hypothetical protein ACGFJ7_23420 [Actinoplanes sp. NPDC048988]|uniref:hypothetical protein n=1 Tax=Actinoplanes sp. NPDC048988 TaxID=3363901 RepID=UPI003722ED5F
MDGPTDTYPLLSGAAGYAYRDEPSATADDEEPPTEEFTVVPAVDPAPSWTAEPSPAPRRGLRPKAAIAVIGAVLLLGVGGVVVSTSSGPSPRGTASPDSGPADRGQADGQAESGQAENGQPDGDEAQSGQSEGDPAPGSVPAFAAGTFNLASSVGELSLTLGRPENGPIQISTHGNGQGDPDNDQDPDRNRGSAGNSVPNGNNGRPDGSGPDGNGSGPDGSGPDGSGAAVAVNGTEVRVTTGGPEVGRVDVVLDQRIDWTIRMSGGVRAATFALAGGSVSGVDLAGGADTVRLTLPGRDRALPVRMSGGVRDWSITTDGEVPVRVLARSGAGEVTLYGQRQSGIARDTTLTAGNGTGLDVTAAAGFGSLTVTADNRPSGR